jgi:hypothetical protein
MGNSKQRACNKRSKGSGQCCAAAAMRPIPPLHSQVRRKFHHPGLSIFGRKKEKKGSVGITKSG